MCSCSFQELPVVHKQFSLGTAREWLHSATKSTWPLPSLQRPPNLTNVHCQRVIIDGHEAQLASPSGPAWSIRTICTARVLFYPAGL